jgi:succinate dehydrogenase/fumarate reductase cytochrome b subunit
MEDTIQKLLEWLMSNAELMASEGFRIAYKQVQFEAMYQTTGGILSLFGIFVTVLLAIKYNRCVNKKSLFYDNLWLMIPSWVIILLLIFGLPLLVNGLGKLYNPEYYTLIKLLDFIK